MSEPPNSGEINIDPGEVNIWVFPHLKELIVMDARRYLPGRPATRLLYAKELFDLAFYQKLEKAFSSMIREEEHPFLNFMTLPEKVGDQVRWEALSAIIRKLNEDVEDTSMPKVAIFLCSGPALFMPPNQIRDMVIRIFQGRQDPPLMEKSVGLMETLIQKEREWVEKVEQEQIKEMIKGGSQDYFTLWQTGE